MNFRLVTSARIARRVEDLIEPGVRRHVQERVIPPERREAERLARPDRPRPAREGLEAACRRAWFSGGEAPA